LSNAAPAFHYRLAGERADIAQAEHGGAIGHNRHQVSTRRVFKGQLGLFLNFKTRLGHAGCVGEAQIVLRAAGFGGNDLDLALPAEPMVVEYILLANFHVDLCEQLVRVPDALRT
jgi:hypothetical protein